MPVKEHLLRKRFDGLSEDEQQEFFAKLIHACNNDDWSLFYAVDIISGAEKRGVFKDVKFGKAVYEENNLITITG